MCRICYKVVTDFFVLEISAVYATLYRCLCALKLFALPFEPIPHRPKVHF
jgi:hypothetical protein